MARRLSAALMMLAAAPGAGTTSAAGPGSLVFDNPHYPACCETAMPGTVSPLSSPSAADSGVVALRER